jgi:hypothetical protein
VQQYKKATIYFSRETTSIAAVIPAMDRLNTKLNRQTKEPYHPSIRAAMKLAAKKLDHYYSLTDSSDMYRIAMGMYKSYALLRSRLTQRLHSSSPWTQITVLPVSELER